MEKQKHSQQPWWQLGVLVLVMVGLLILAHRVAPSTGWRIFLESGVVIAGYGLIMVWLNTHPAGLLDRDCAEFDSQSIELLEREMSAAPSAHVQVQFYAHSAPAIIYDMPADPASRVRSNGHHPARTIPHLPQEVSNN